MTKDLLNINGKFYSKVNFNTEDEFESHISNKIANIYNNFLVVDFKMLLKTNDYYTNDVKADFILISKDYKRWIIVEVEYYSKSKHNWLEDHVVPQMNKIININYNEQNQANKIFSFIKNKLIKQDIDFDNRKMENLINFNKPDFLVIINDYPLDIINWKTSLYNCELSVIRCFKDNLENYIYSKEIIKEFDEISLAHIGKRQNILTVEKPSLIYLLDLKLLDINIVLKNEVMRSTKWKINSSNPKTLELQTENINLKRGIYSIVNKNGILTLSK